MSIRETPAPLRTHAGVAGPSHPHAPAEPVLHVDNIQGNILGGFNKDFQTLVFLKIRRPAAFKNWLKPKIPWIASLAEVVAFNRLYKSMRYRRKSEPGLKVTWVNIAFSYKGLQKLGAINVRDNFVDNAFKEGLPSRSKLLSDPINDREAEGHPKNWLVGGTSTPVDVVLIVAGDDREDVERTVNEWLDDIGPAAELVGLRGKGRESGQNLPAELAGHEQFGFLDGVSQPGIRGTLSENEDDVLTVRQNPDDPDQGKPGQDLIWPGEFVFGYSGGDPKAFKKPGPVVSAGPAWANDGSFLVFRRLRQDVAGFHKFLKAKSREVRGKGAPEVTADLLGAQLVGRWRSGAPLMRTKSLSQNANDTDIPALGDADCANNNFEFQSRTAPLPSTPQDPVECTDRNTDPPPPRFPAAASDPKGLVCPFTSHIRKVYPRDDERLSHSPPQAGDETFPLNENTTQTHRILRRGIPYGPPLRHGKQFSTPEKPADDDKVDRGLHFLCYQTSIERQFEFITSRWVNNPDFKEPADATGDRSRERPPNEQGGHDPIIGQNNAAGGKRVRAFNVAVKDEAGRRIGRRITSKDGSGTGVDWVIPTGGGYFFAPSLEALETRLT